MILKLTTASIQDSYLLEQGIVLIGTESIIRVEAKEREFRKAGAGTYQITEIESRAAMAVTTRVMETPEEIYAMIEAHQNISI